MRVVVAVIGTVVLGPLVIASGGLAALALLAEWISGLNPFGDSGGLLGYLYGGPGSGSGSFVHYVGFMVGAVVAGGSWAGLAKTWAWARHDSSQVE
jgi:hypothetical protein